MRIAVIGAGISGLTAAYALQRVHQITLFEANDYLGGHTNTIDVEDDGKQHCVDTGFIVFNNHTYPNFTGMLDDLGVASKPTTMSFSVKCDRSGLEYRGADVNGLFAQRRNLINPRFLRLLRDLVRFNKRALALLPAEEDLTVAEFFEKHQFSNEFIEQYFLPMGSAVWSCPRGTLQEFPIRFVLDFYRNHGMLAVRGRPQWRVIEGGSRAYVESMMRGFEGVIHLQTPITSISRCHEYVEITLACKQRQRFDQVIFACHSDQALRILGEEAMDTEREVLVAFPYEKNVAQLHTDTTVLPKSRRAWASWNYHVPHEDPEKATVTYNMNMLQGIQSKNVYNVTLNGEKYIDPEKVIRRIEYAHPIFTTERSAAQRRHGELIKRRRTSFCGAYWGNGFHEDGVNSALAVSKAFLGSDQ